MSPSAAMKTSSPWDRKTFFVSPGRLAKRKNLSVMGGGGGTGGGWRRPASLSVVPFPLSFSMGTDPTTKMFLPLPAYLISSLWLRSFRSSVGSNRGSTTGTIFPGEERRTPGRAAVEGACVAAGAVAVDEGQNSRLSKTSG